MILLEAVLRLFGAQPQRSPSEKAPREPPPPPLELRCITPNLAATPLSPQLPRRKCAPRTPRSAPPPSRPAPPTTNNTTTAAAIRRAADALPPTVDALLRQHATSEQTVLLAHAAEPPAWLRQHASQLYVVGGGGGGGADWQSGELIRVAPSSPSEWPHALALAGFDWRRPSTWLLRLDAASEPQLLRHLRAAATLAAPGSALILLSASALAPDVAAAAGFGRCQRAARSVLLLTRAQRGVHGAAATTAAGRAASPATSMSSLSTLSDSACVVRFSLHAGSLPAEVRRRVARGALRVVGERRQLGAWQPQKALALIEAGEAFVGELLLSSALGEYKYVFVDDDGGVLWEHGDNRSLPTHGERLLNVEDAWRVE